MRGRPRALPSRVVGIEGEVGEENERGRRSKRRKGRRRKGCEGRRGTGGCIVRFFCVRQCFMGLSGYS